MDWKLPATIVILIAIISFGSLPFFSSEFSKPITDVLSTVRSFFYEMFHQKTEFNENVTLSISTNGLDELKIGIPVNAYFNLSGDYELKIDDKSLVVKQKLFLDNFTGVLKFTNFSISGEAIKISAEGFELDGRSKISSTNKNFNEFGASNLQIGELTIRGGRIKTTSPQKIDAETEDIIELYGFRGTLLYKNNRVTLNGTCTRIKTKGFSLG